MNSIKLRPYVEVDISTLNSIRNDRQTLSMMNAVYTKHESMIDTQKWAANQQAMGGFQIVEYLGECAGFIKSRPFSFGDRACMHQEIGIVITSTLRGKGVASLAVFEYLSSVKEGRFLVRIIDDNSASKNLFLKIGFKEIGRVTGVITPNNDADEAYLDIVFMEYLK